MSSRNRSVSLFDDIFQLQSTVPDFDPEDPEDGFKSGLTEGATEVEALGSTQLRKQTAIIPDDPKYRGKKISRKSLYSDDEDEVASEFSESDQDVSDDRESSEDADEEGEDEEGEEEVDDDGEESFDDDDSEELGKDGKKKDAVILTPSDSNDKEKGKAVSCQLSLWDDLIKCRISLQKLITSCNRLPTSKVWGEFDKFSSFHKESSDAHSAVRELLSGLMDLQQQLFDKQAKEKTSKVDDDEEITSESELEDEKETTTEAKDERDEEEMEHDDGDDINQGEDGGEEEEMDSEDESEESTTGSKKAQEEPKKRLTLSDVERTLAKRHKKFRSFRNRTLEKWDEKTRLSHAKIKSKNFAAFDISVLTQIQQVLGNRDRLIRRIHQNRSSVRILGEIEAEKEKAVEEVVVEDDEDVVEVQQRVMCPELDMNYDIVDDSDFYQMCLRDFIQLKQNEETDPAMASKHWLEIQNLRRKHKRKVDTRASKGRKIRYHVKEKLKNFMAPYDKSQWSDEQKDDLFKALFGGRRDPDIDNTEKASKEDGDRPTINIGL